MSAKLRAVRPAGRQKIKNIRPYQLMCLVCRIGRNNGAPPNPADGKLYRLYRIFQKNRRQLCRLCVNVNPLLPYAYQNPGPADDTAEGPLFNLKRDLDVLQRLGLFPGDVRPANELLAVLLKQLRAPGTMCGRPQAMVEEWRGCADAGKGYYEKGREVAADVIFPPLRTPVQRKTAKESSAAEIYRARELVLRTGRKEIEILQVLDLRFGDVLPARLLMQRVFERIKSTKEICGYGDGVVRGGWHVCGAPDGSPAYAQSRAAGLGIPGMPKFDNA